MSIEIRRVPLDFDWPPNTIWYGFLNPYCDGVPCKACEKSGYNPPTLAIYHAYWGHDTDGPGWRCGGMTVDEVVLLHREGWFAGWGRRFGINPETCVECGVPRHGEPPLREEEVDLALFNARMRKWRPFYNNLDYKLIRHRAERLGVFGFCKWCDGHGCIRSTTDPAVLKMYEDWESLPPPEGEGWQIWQTVSEGGPVSPVFATPEELAKWAEKTQPFMHPPTVKYETWLRIITENDDGAGLLVVDTGMGFIGSAAAHDEAVSEGRLPV